METPETPAISVHTFRLVLKVIDDYLCDAEEYNATGDWERAWTMIAKARKQIARQREE